MSIPNIPINTFSRHYRRKYGGPVGKIAFDAGIPCPNREKGGCVYCAAESFTPFYLEKKDDIETQLAKGRKYLASKNFSRFFAYFQQETTTALSFDRLAPKLDAATDDRDCVGLIISTRPDFLDEALLDYLKGLGERGEKREALLELGLQSAHDRTLLFLNRNHTFEDFAKAAERVKKKGTIQLGVHLILGIPGEAVTDMIETIEAVTALGVDYIKLHHLQVIRDTPLAAMYGRSPFKTFDAPEYLEILATILSHIPSHVVLHRLWSTADPEILVAPQWKKFSYELHTLLLKIMAERDLHQGKNVKGAGERVAL